MKTAKVLDSPPIQLAIAAVIVIGVVYFLIRKTFSDVGESIRNINEGTPFAGTGPIGTLGNIANTVSGGSLARVGEKISSFFTPKAAPSADRFYVATFPDGQPHAISSLDVNVNGFFTRAGIRYRLAFNQSGKRIAVQS